MWFFVIRATDFLPTRSANDRCQFAGFVKILFDSRHGLSQKEKWLWNEPSWKGCRKINWIFSGVRFDSLSLMLATGDYVEARGGLGYDPGEES